jgi:hypothetical protein
MLLHAGAIVTHDYMGNSPLEDLVAKLEELKSSKGGNRGKKGKKNDKKDKNHSETQEINKWIIELSLKLPVPTHAFESLKDNDLADELLLTMLKLHHGKTNFIAAKVQRWEEHFMSFTGVNRFLSAVARFWKKSKEPLTIGAGDLTAILKCLAYNCQSATIESLCAYFYQPHNLEWLTPEILHAFSVSLSQAMKVAIFGYEPYLDNCVDFVYCAGKIYFRMVLASSHLERFRSFDVLQSFWPLLEEVLNLFDENVQETNRFSALVYIFHLWCQVNSLSGETKDEKSEEKSSSPKKASLHSLETHPVPTETFRNFAQKFRTALIYLAEECQDCAKYLGFIPSMDHTVDLAARSAIFSLVISRESFKLGDEDIPLVLNRMDGDFATSVDVAVGQFLDIPGYSLNQSLEVEFVGEQGIGDGPAREALHYIFSLLKKLEVFALSPSAEVYTLNFDYAHPNAAMHFECAGRIVAASITRSLPLGFPICKMLLKYATKRSNLFDIMDLQDYDKDLCKSLKYIAENDISKMHEMHWVCNGNNGAEVELVNGGANLPVTNENKQKYIKAYAEFKVLGLPKTRFIDNFSTGFQSVMIGQWLQSLSVEDLFLLVNGPRTIDVPTLRKRTQFTGFEDGTHPITEWFWEVFTELEDDHKKKLLLFWTGSEVPPICLDNAENGSSYSEEERWNIEQLDCSTRNLPQSSTCSHTLKFPLYESKQVLHDKILQAIQYGASGYDKE